MINEKERFPKRKSTHMKYFDYGENHRYFITICSDNKRKISSDISVGEGLAPPVIHLSAIGKIIEEQLLALSPRYPEVEIENHVIMPNHIHMILRLENTGGASPSQLVFREVYGNAAIMNTSSETRTIIKTLGSTSTTTLLIGHRTNTTNNKPPAPWNRWLLFLYSNYLIIKMSVTSS